MAKKKHNRLLLLLVAALIGYFAYIYINQQFIINNKTQSLKDYQQKIQVENKKNRQLEKQKETINSDEYIEKYARDKLGMVKDGEKIFIDPDK